MIKQIMSGCQTGADEAGLAVAYNLGIDTFGYMPKGFRTEIGNRPDLAKKYNLIETNSLAYPPRTRANVYYSGATVIFGNYKSRGCALTIKYCKELNKPYYLVEAGYEYMDEDYTIDEFVEWLREKDIKILNVAGNRESTNPGIYSRTYTFLYRALEKYGYYKATAL